MPKIRSCSAIIGVKFATGTYTGDGNATQAITGVGFQPKYVLIWKQVDASNYPAMKTDVDGLFAEFFVGGTGSLYRLDMIVSLDTDGFTVGDGTGYGNVLNIGTRKYAYNCWG